MIDKNFLKITFIGDIMSDSTQIPNLLKLGYECAFKNVTDYLNRSDLLVANLETPISEDSSKFCNGEYSFCAPVELLSGIKKLNKNLVLLTANNHVLDRGVSGLTETLNLLEKFDIKHTGTQIDKSNKFIVVNLDGCKVGILNYTYGTNAFCNNQYLGKHQQHYVNLLQNQELSNKLLRSIQQGKNFVTRAIKKVFTKLRILQFNKKEFERTYYCKKKIASYCKTIKEVNNNSDVCISCLHIGGQYNPQPSRYTTKTVSKSLKCGADIIIANHEHVIHSVTIHNGKFVAYSLGNFLGTNGVIKPPFNTMSEYSIGVNVYINKQNCNDRRYSFTIFCSTLGQNNVVCVNTLYSLINNAQMPADKVQKYKNDYCFIASKLIQRETKDILEEVFIN